MVMRQIRLCGAIFLVQASFFFAGSAQAAPNVAQTAARVDALLAEDHYGAPAGEEGKTSQPAPLVDDSTFLRRASLDIVGALPKPEQVTAFVLDPTPDKRTKLVEKLLSRPEYGQNWARYWRDVIYMRRSDGREVFGEDATTDFLTAEFNKGTHWDEIATKFITATGDVTEHGECGIILAQKADPSNVTAEMSRIFMGVQIQCAQCHNHPFDRWKREQFHQMAAFFPRVGLRPNPKQERSLFVVSLQRETKRRSPGDTEGTKLEHYMPDLENPEAEGTLMTPIFYATGKKLSPGASDEVRRTQLAEWMTSRGNHWFDKAFVNRMWGELVGRGFQEPLDDLGPDRKPVAPKTFEYLSRSFASADYDHKWLVKVVTATQIYQRSSRPRHDASEDQFAASCTQRLRGDQLFDALASALGIVEPAPIDPNGQRPQVLLRLVKNSPRGQVNETFGYDPSDHRDEIASSIPQSLFLMNSPGLARATSARNPSGTLGPLLDKESNNENVVVELYLRTLAREPKTAELKHCLDYVNKLEDRATAFEDIQWALINSTEFLFRK